MTRLNGDSELIVLTASGANMWSVARPLLALALVVAIAVSIVNHFVMPWSLRELREMTMKMRTDLIGQVIQPGRFSSPEFSLTFHIRDRALNGDLLGVLMQDNRDPKQAMSYLAERGVVQKQGRHSYLFMTKGHIIRRDRSKGSAANHCVRQLRGRSRPLREAGRDGRAEAAGALLPGARQPAAQRPGFRQAARLLQGRVA